MISSTTEHSGDDLVTVFGIAAFCPSSFNSCLVGFNCYVRSGITQK